LLYKHSLTCSVTWFGILVVDIHFPTEEKSDDTKTAFTGRCICQFAKYHITSVRARVPNLWVATCKHVVICVQVGCGLYK
jgi:hypothetical protein